MSLLNEWISICWHSKDEYLLLWIKTIEKFRTTLLRLTTQKLSTSSLLLNCLPAAQKLKSAYSCMWRWFSHLRRASSLLTMRKLGAFILCTNIAYSPRKSLSWLGNKKKWNIILNMVYSSRKSQSLLRVKRWNYLLLTKIVSYPGKSIFENNSEV